MPTEDDPKTLFDRWFVAPLRSLETLSNGDGAFVALMVSLSLYERFAKAIIKNDTLQKANETNFYKRLATDFSITEDQAKTFWEVMRHGFQHQAMAIQSGQGKNSKPKWLVSGDLPTPIQYGRSGSEQVLLVQPWLFRDVVLKLYEVRPDMIASSQSFPWASIFMVEFEA